MSRSPPPEFVFALPGHRHLLEGGFPESSGLRVGEASFRRFSNRELHLRLHTDVADADCVVLGSLAPPDEQLLWVSLAAHTLKLHGARAVLAALPYLGYGRQDRLEPGQSLGTAWAGTVVQASGVDEVLTIDVHSPIDQDQFPIPLRSLSPARLFAASLAGESSAGLCVVAPDEGALRRCEALVAALGTEAPVTHLEKQRTATGIVHRRLVGSVGPRAVVVDDILDTGETLVSCCRQLRRAGVQDITIMVTHGLFTGERWHPLRSLARRVCVTDSVPAAREHASAAIEVLPARPLLVEALGSLRANYGSERRGGTVGPRPARA